MLITVSFGCKKVADPTPETATGSISATISGTSWNGNYCGALASGTASSVIVAVVGKAAEKNVKGEDVISIGLFNFVGVGTYTPTSKQSCNLSVVYNGKTYNVSPSTASAPTVKITESTAPASILSPGKVVGEFSATLKVASGTETITITNGKFTAIRVL